ncbi:MAG TPA: SRPBCC family protein, partial [Mycobacterium sp.]|nr:SRPBCC family protein [Mycobacterium sp.]
MNKTTHRLFAAGLGAAAMYFLDPRTGRRRRSVLRDKARHGVRVGRDYAGTTYRDVQHRLEGMGAIARNWGRSQPVTDDVVVQRVRTRLGRLVSHPSSITVNVRDGVVSLSGPILQRELERTRRQIPRVAGVRGLENFLEPHEQPEQVPGLQGEARTPRNTRFEFLQDNWSPSARLLGGAAGAWFGMRLFRRGLLNKLQGVGGMLLLSRAISNETLKRLLGVEAPREPLEIRKTLRIHAPLERVFALWDDYASFPHFMHNVREVERLDEQRSRWTVRRPGGGTLCWEALLTERRENELLAWHTHPGSTTQLSGSVRFRPWDDGKATEVELVIAYTPIAGRAGQALTELFGASPKKEVEQDLVRMKSFLETG